MGMHVFLAVTASFLRNISSADRADYFSEMAIQYALLIGAFVVTLAAQLYVNNTAKKFSQVRVSNGMTGADVAMTILKANGLSGIPVTRSGKGGLSDHYDPKNRTVALSDEVFGKSTITAVAVAAHECGHAIQHAEGYAPLRLRTNIAPAVQAANMFSWIMIIIGLLFALTPFTMVGVILFIVVIAFQLITLPVEFNASSRALAILNNSGTLNASEMKGAKKVLTAAAMTYVAALASSVMTLIRLVLLTRRR